MTDDSPGPTRSTDSTPSPSATTRNRRGRAAHVTVAGVRISNPDRVLFPESGLTKRGLAEYYAAVADRMLPHVRSRPLSTLRCPRGRTGKCFFQKHPRETLGDPIRSIRVPEKGGTAEMIAIDSAEGLVSLAQFGVIELHPWGATEGALDTPDLLTFDLDPGEGVDWAAIPPAARRVRDELEVVGLRSFVKLSGGKGVHVVVPLAPRAGWDQTKAFCRALAVRIARQEPQRFVATMSKARRRGRIFIDYLRNAPGATSIAPYSVRARPGAPVAVPIRWDELGRVDGGAHATVDRLPRRLAQLRREPWDEFDEQRRTQSLTDERLAAFGAD